MSKIYHPYGPHLWIKVLPPEEEIIKISGEKKAKPVLGEVLGISPEVEGIKVGEVILYDYYSAVDSQEADDEFLIIHKDEVLAIVTEEENGS